MTALPSFLTLTLIFGMMIICVSSSRFACKVDCVKCKMSSKTKWYNNCNEQCTEDGKEYDRCLPDGYSDWCTCNGAEIPKCQAATVILVAGLILSTKRLMAFLEAYVE